MKAALALILLAGCALADSAPEAPPMPPEIWRVVAIGGVPFAADNSFGISPADGVYGGQGPCNRYFGSVTTDPFPAVILSTPGATRMACPALAEEAALFAALGRVERMGVGTDAMTLITADGQEIALTRR